MSRAVNVIAIFMILILAVIFQLTLSGKSARAEEIENNMDTAIEQTVENVLKTQKYSIADKNEFIADFIQNLALNLDSDSDITVEVLKANPDKGILSINVIATYIHPNGNTGEYESNQTVIFERFEDEETVINTYIVSFYRNLEDLQNEKAAYKIFELQEGSSLILPLDPVQDGKTFSGWKDESGNKINISELVTESEAFYATYN